MANNEYYVSLLMPARFEYVREWSEVQNILDEGGGFTVLDNEIEVSLEHNREPFLMLENILKEERVPFDRYASLTLSIFDDDVIYCNRFFRPSGCICGEDYDKEFALGPGGIYTVPVDELQKLLTDNENEVDADAIKAKIQLLILEYSPYAKAIEDC